MSMNQGWTFGSWFSGIGGVDSAAKKLKLYCQFMVEIEEKLCKIARLNFSNVFQQDVAGIETEFFYADVFHCSPPCKHFSLASKQLETEEDIEFSNQICKYLLEVTPKIFTLENVENYKYSKSFSKILDELNYIYRFVKVNSILFEDYGLPQHRKRLLIQASNNKFDLPQKQKRISWDKVLDINKMAFVLDNNLKSLPKLNYHHYYLSSTRNGTWGNSIRNDGELAPTVVATEYKGYMYVCHYGTYYKLGVKDYAILQGFYEDYNFGRWKIPAIIGIGNAVPPKCYELFLREML